MVKYTNRKLPKFINILVIVFIILTILYTYNVFKIQDCTTVTDESEPHLHWKWNGGNYSEIYYFIFLLVLLSLSYYGLDNAKFNTIIILISFIISLLIYGKKHSAGALWCFAAAFAPLILLIYYRVLALTIVRILVEDSLIFNLCFMRGSPLQTP